MLCPYKNCLLNCFSMSHHKYKYAKMNDTKTELINVRKKQITKEEIKRSPKVNWEVYYKLYGCNPNIK